LKSIPVARRQHFENRDHLLREAEMSLAGKALDAGHPLYKVVVRMLEHFRASGHARKKH
jgi:hypothetical protein